MAKKAYFVGAKGVAMSGLALILKKQGWRVSGSDVNQVFITDKVLDEIGLQPLIGFKRENISNDINLVVYSPSHQGKQNVEVKEAVKKGIPVISEAELIAKITKQAKKTVAAAGCHGKTTTASLLAYSLIKLNQEPSYLIGAPSFNNYLAADYNCGKKGYFVVEADEYAIDPSGERKPKFSLLYPQAIILTNVDYDHVDIYHNIEAVKKEFKQFIKKLINSKGKLIFNQDDKNSRLVASALPKKWRLSYGYSPAADLQILAGWQTTQFGSVFNLSFYGKNLGRFRTGLFGKKSILDASAVILFLLSEGFSIKKIKLAIKNFTGAKRRFEKIYEKNSCYLFDDYGHHPEEIKATINAVRTRFPKKKLIIIFQPHTYSRTLKFRDEFSQVLSEADKAIILPIFSSAREKKTDFNISSRDIVTSGQRLGKENLVSVVNKKELLLSLSWLKKEKNWLILTMGAGDIYRWENDIIKMAWPT